MQGDYYLHASGNSLRSSAVNRSGTGCARQVGASARVIVTGLHALELRYLSKYSQSARTLEIAVSDGRSCRMLVPGPGCCKCTSSLSTCLNSPLAGKTDG